MNNTNRVGYAEPEGVSPRLLASLNEKGFYLHWSDLGKDYPLYPVYYTDLSKGLRTYNGNIMPLKAKDGMVKAIWDALYGRVDRQELPKLLAQMGTYQEPTHYRQVLGAFLHTTYQTLLEEDFYADAEHEDKDTAEVCEPL